MPDGFYRIAGGLAVLPAAALAKAGRFFPVVQIFQKLPPPASVGMLRRTNSPLCLTYSFDSIAPVLCNRYGLPMVEFKMGRRQGATREHVLCDL